MIKNDVDLCTCTCSFVKEILENAPYYVKYMFMCTMSALLLKFFYPELPQISDELNRKIIATEADSNSAVSCLEEADSHQCVGIPSIHSPGQSCLPPVSSPIERKSLLVRLTLF